MLPPANLLGRVSGLFQSTAVAGQMVGILLTPLLVPSLLSIGLYFGIATLLLIGLVAIMLRQPTGTSVISATATNTIQPDPASGD
jgi:hypothetical protein